MAVQKKLRTLFKSAVGYFVVETTEEETDRTSKTTTKKLDTYNQMSRHRCFIWETRQALTGRQTVEHSTRNWKSVRLAKSVEQNTIAELSGLIKQIQKRRWKGCGTRCWVS